MADFGGSEGGLSPLFYNGYVGHTRHAVLSRLPVIRFRFALWLPPGRGEEKTPSRDDGTAAYKRRIAAPNSVPVDTKRLRKTTVLRSLCFCCKKQGVATAGCVRLQPVDALQPWVGFGKEKKGWSNHPFSFSTSVFAPTNAVMYAGSNPVTQPPDAPRRAVSPGRSPRSRGQGVPARFNGGDGVLRGFRGRNRNLPLIP